MPVRVERVVTSGPHVIDGRPLTLENNAWLVGDDDEVVVVDAPHDVAAIAAAVGGRRTVAIVATHAHADHVALAPALGARLAAPVLLHPADLPLWHAVHPADVVPDGDLADGDLLQVAGADLEVRHTPGHTPGSCCIVVEALAGVLTGDTLFPGGPGSTRGPSASFPTIIQSIRTRLFTLPAATDVLPGHGEATTIGAELPQLQEWVDRGW